MKVTLISLHAEILSIGIRSLSACLKKAGHEIQLIFLIQDWEGKTGIHRYRSKYSQELLNEVCQVCQDSDLVGVSFLTNYLSNAVAITSRLKEEIDVPIIWGGVHPTIKPEESLNYVDIVCIGEGEEALVELANKMDTGKDYHDTRNFWFRNGRKIIRNELRPLIQDLDSLPFADFELFGHFVHDNNRLVQLTDTTLQKYNVFKRVTDSEGTGYLILTSRGCPYHCTYCCNNFFRKMYPNQRYLRRRSPNNVFEELEEMMRIITDVDFILFADDNFTALSSRQLREFLEKYKARIGLPFSCSVSPATISERKVRYLIEAGVYGMQLGIQTGSDRMLRLYKRDISIKQSEKALEILEKYRPSMSLNKRVNYHFIIDNPYETAKDKIQTLEFLLKIPNRKDALCFSLVLFPGTEIYQQAKDDGIVVDERGQIYEKDYQDHQPTLVKYWLKLYWSNFPAPLLRLLLNRRLFAFLDNGNSKRTSTVVFGLVEYVLRGYYLVGRMKGFLLRYLLSVPNHQKH